MKLIRAALLLSLLSFVCAYASSTYLAVQGPVQSTLYNNGSIYLGKVGPGESFYILANSSTINSTGSYVGPIGWDSLTASNLPSGWSSQSSPLYQNPMKMKITVSPSTPNGNYSFLIHAINVQNYSGIGNLTFTARINVTTNVFDLQVSPQKIYSGIGQPTDLQVMINNTGISDDPFIISAKGLPAWNLSDQVISLHSKANTFTYPIFQNEPGVYNFNLTVSSSTSPLISKSYPVTFYVNESIYNDYKAIGQGAVLSPFIFEPAYSFMSLLSYLYKVLLQG